MCVYRYISNNSSLLKAHKKQQGVKCFIWLGTLVVTWSLQGETWLSGWWDLSLGEPLLCPRSQLTLYVQKQIVLSPPLAVSELNLGMSNYCCRLLYDVLIFQHRITHLAFVRGLPGVCWVVWGSFPLRPARHEGPRLAVFCLRVAVVTVWFWGLAWAPSQRRQALFVIASLQDGAIRTLTYFKCVVSHGGSQQSPSSSRWFCVLLF